MSVNVNVQIHTCLYVLAYVGLTRVGPMGASCGRLKVNIVRNVYQIQFIHNCQSYRY